MGLPSGVDTFDSTSIVEGAPSKTGGAMPARATASGAGTPVGGTDNMRADMTVKSAAILTTPAGKRSRPTFEGGRDAGTLTIYRDGTV